MNDKQAKKLRRLANESGAMSETSYVQVPLSPKRPHNGSIFVSPMCVRGVYKALKHEESVNN